MYNRINKWTGCIFASLSIFYEGRAGTVEDRLINLENRMTNLENRVTQQETRMAVAENNIETINKKLDKIDNNTTWLLRIVIGSVVLAVLGWVISEKPQMAVDFIKGVFDYV